MPTDRPERRTKGRAIPGEQYLSRRPGRPHWQISFRIGGMRFRASSGTEDREAAAALADREWKAAWRRLNLGETAPEQLTLNDAFARYYREECAGTAYGERTQRYNMVVLLRAFGRQTLLSELTDQKVAAGVHWLRTRSPARKGQPRQISQATINRYLTTLSVVCRHAAKLWGVAVGSWNKAEHTRREAERPEVFLTYAQGAALVDAACGHLRPILLTSLMTGLRLGNTVQLQWEQVSLDMARAVLLQKGGRRLVVSLPAPLVDTLAALEPQREQRHGPVFRFGNPNQPCNCPTCRQPRRAGEPIRSVKRTFATAVKDAGIAAEHAFRWHDMRHTFASWSLAEDGNLLRVSRALGHTNIATTTRYAHIMPGTQEHAAAGVSSKLSTARSGHQSGHQDRPAVKKA